MKTSATDRDSEQAVIMAELAALRHAIETLPGRVADELQRRSERQSDPPINRLLTAIEKRFGHQCFTVREACSDAEFRRVLMQIYPGGTPVTLGRLFGSCVGATVNSRTLRRDGLLNGVQVWRVTND